ncbi:MAG TPA: hypothetical protein VFC51_12290 [Chloroflexota bacterium]|nr:hypothetical protein [Chloroflexota bacterium]
MKLLRWFRILSTPLLVVANLVLAATAVLQFFTVRESLHVTQDMLTATKKSFELSKRAWIIPMYVIPTGRQPFESGVRITLHNFGESPAFDVKADFSIDLAPRGQKFEPPTRRSGPSGVVPPFDFAGADVAARTIVPIPPPTEVTSLKGRVEVLSDGLLTLRIPLAVGADKLAPFAGRYGSRIRYLSLVLPRQ